MYYRTKNYVWSQAVVDAMLSALETRPAAALLVTPTMILYKTGPAPNPGSAFADFTANTFHGYANAVLTFAGPVNLTDGSQALICTANFTATAGGTVNESSLGYIISDGAAAFYGGELFPTPFNFGAPGDFLSVDLILPIPVRISPVP